MSVIIKDQELDYELQELYLTGKQWMSDVDFMDSERMFLQGLTGSLTANEQADFTLAINRASIDCAQVRLNVSGFMQMLEPLITKQNPQPDKQLIEDFISLQRAIAGAMEDLRILKYRIVRARHAA